MRVLAIDPAIRNTGFAVIEGLVGKEPQALEYGTISLPARLPQSACLLAIKQHIDGLIKKWEPDELAVERIIFVQSHQTAIIMGSARAAVILAAAENGLRVVEYSPTSVKLAAVGRGSARKDQVAFMMRAILHLTETPQSDAADALAIALAHLSSSDPSKATVIDRKYI
jgi:crossover junction endodeoxyribonuclease RuvC